MFFFSSRRRHTRFDCDWSSDVCSSDLERPLDLRQGHTLAIERVISLRTDFQRPEILFPQRPVRFAARRQLQLEPLLEERRGDDEDDEQHERQVEQRRDVDVAQRHQRTALREAAHGVNRRSKVERREHQFQAPLPALDTRHGTFDASSGYSSLARNTSSSSRRYSISILETSSWAKLSRSTVNTRRL